MLSRLPKTVFISTITRRIRKTCVVDRINFLEKICREVLPEELAQNTLRAVSSPTDWDSERTSHKSIQTRRD